MFESFGSDPARSAWTLGVVLGLPLALLLLTEAVVRLRRQGSPVESPLRVVRNVTSELTDRHNKKLQRSAYAALHAEMHCVQRKVGL